jgi:cytidylate kinase
MIITIDGPSGTGKSTVAKKLADEIGFTYFDTGAMYRSVTHFLQVRGISPADHDKIKEALKDFSYDIRNEPTGKRYFVGNEDVTVVIRSQEVTNHVSEVSAIPFIRHHMVSIQQQYGRRSNAVFEGRDLGTVVFPEAELKVFLTASSDIRAERRHKEILEKSKPNEKIPTLKEIKDSIDQRDHNDATRKISPLKQADNAVLIDTSHLSVDQVIAEILKAKKARGL